MLATRLPLPIPSPIRVGLFGVLLLETGLADNPPHAAMGELILRNLSDGP